MSAITADTELVGFNENDFRNVRLPCCISFYIFLAKRSQEK